MYEQKFTVGYKMIELREFFAICFAIGILLILLIPFGLIFGRGINKRIETLEKINKVGKHQKEENCDETCVHYSILYKQPDSLTCNSCKYYNESKKESKWHKREGGPRRGG